jgi:hypothetical protein
MFLLLATLFAQNEQSTVVRVAADVQLGHGYRLVWRTEDLSKCKDCFEGLAHYHDLYRGTKRIGKAVGKVSISPSGRFAAFEENGALRLFDATKSRSVDVTDGVFAIPKEFHWTKQEDFVHISYYEKHAISIIRTVQSKE